jgi:hypothetical protein
VDDVMQLWSSSKPSRVTPAGEATLPILGRAYRHADDQTKATGEG